MSFRKNFFNVLKGILVLIIMFALLNYLMSLIPVRDTREEDYKRFYPLKFNGRITTEDAGRGLKIQLDNYDEIIEPPGRYCIGCKTDFYFQTGENIGDSLIKKANSDTFILKKANGEIIRFKIVK